MESIACEKWTVSLLKQYLRDRAVPHSGYCKEKLVKLVKNSHENPSLVDQVEPTDGESVSESRRTITVNGDVVVFPDPHLLTGWDDNLTKIPSITSACCLIYLMNKKGWPAKRLENFENERGYQLCNDNHINTVQIKPHDGNMSYIRAKCIRQTAQKESPYCVWLLATNRGNIEASGCQCIGDDGSCKHVVALMYAVANFVHRNEVSLSIQRPTPTDLLCTWDKPHKSSEPLRIYHTDGRHDTSSPRPTVPHPESMYKACVFGSAYQDEDMDNDFRALLKETNAVHLQQSYEPSPATKFITLPELAQQFQREQCTSFIVDLSQHFTDTIRENIRKFTKAQAKCSLWKKQRVGALTSTTLHLAAHYSRDCSDNYVVDSIMGQSKFSGNSATEYGKRSEPFVRKLYYKNMKHKHESLKVSETGLFICETNPILRVSPDGVVKCKCCGTGLLEIKCPYSTHTNSLTGEEVARRGKYHVVLGNDGKVHLKKSSAWYTQVQAHLGVTGYPWCDFVLFTKKEPCLTIERIYFDKSRFEADVTKAMFFYEKFIYQRLFDRNTSSGN